MFETETVGPCLVRKLKWWSHSPPPATPSAYAPGVTSASLRSDGNFEFFIHWLKFSWKRFEKKQEFCFNNFFGLLFYCIAFSASKFLICFRIFTVRNWTKRKSFIRIYFRYYHFDTRMIFKFIYCVLYWIFCFTLNCSFKVFTRV